MEMVSVVGVVVGGQCCIEPVAQAIAGRVEQLAFRCFQTPITFDGYHFAAPGFETRNIKGIGSGMFASAGSVYLVVTPVQKMGAPWPAYYNGCRVFKFTDIDFALLQKTGAQPTLIGSVNGTSGSFNGACSYHASASNSGMLYSELNTSATDRFQIFMSHTNF